MNGARPIPRPAPWWLEGGEETCDLCLATYAYEVEVRCVDCDQPMCPTCAVWVRRRTAVYCSECAPGSAEAGDEPRPQREAAPRGEG
ncbi:MAG TPA: hypothetical protein VHQ65_12670 [Thermoanaerobaculia bacterium]|nr:hypothetical protein [Thermoanaerobaculia bacterium]